MSNTICKEPQTHRGAALVCTLLLCAALVPAVTRADEVSVEVAKSDASEELAAQADDAITVVTDWQTSEAGTRAADAAAQKVDGSDAQNAAADDNGLAVAEDGTVPAGAASQKAVVDGETASAGAAGSLTAAKPESGSTLEATGTPAAQGDATLSATTTPDMIDKKGYLALSLTREQVEAAFAYGDLLSVTINGQTIEAPLVNDRTFVDQLQPAIVVRQSSDGNYVVELGADNDKFASTFGIAESHKDAQKNTVWTFADGVSNPLTVTISLAKKGGYYDRYVVKQLRYTDKRSDYPQLSDEQFANFREVRTTGIAPGVLYRSATPANPQRGRNTYADACIKKAGVTYAINLSDAEEKLVKYRGYDQSYYATIDHIALHASIHLDSEEYRSDLMRGFRAMANKPGVYLIHCLEGKDRTGIAVALLEFLMGASYDEVIADHMVSFYNYFGITEADPRYESVVHGNLTAFLESYFGVDTLKGRTDLQQKAEQYMLDGGLTPDEIAALKHNLNPAADQAQQPDATQGASTQDPSEFDQTKGKDTPDQTGQTDGADTPGKTGHTNQTNGTDTPGKTGQTGQTNGTDTPAQSQTNQTKGTESLDPSRFGLANGSTTQDPSKLDLTRGANTQPTDQTDSTYGTNTTTPTTDSSSVADIAKDDTDTYGSPSAYGTSHAESASSSRDYSARNASSSDSDTSANARDAYNNDTRGANGNYPYRDDEDSNTNRYKNAPSYDAEPSLPKTSDPHNHTVTLAVALIGTAAVALGLRKARTSTNL